MYYFAGLEHLPVPASRPAPVLNKDHILIADESGYFSFSNNAQSLLTVGQRQE